MIDFVLSKKQRELKEGINSLGKYVIRPMSLDMDRKHEVPEPFLRNFMKLASGFRSPEALGEFSDSDLDGKAAKPKDPSKPSEGNRTAAIGAEELAWADASLLLCL